MNRKTFESNIERMLIETALELTQRPSEVDKSTGRNLRDFGAKWVAKILAKDHASAREEAAYVYDESVGMVRAAVALTNIVAAVTTNGDMARANMLSLTLGLGAAVEVSNMTDEQVSRLPGDQQDELTYVMGVIFRKLPDQIKQSILVALQQQLSEEDNEPEQATASNA